MPNLQDIYQPWFNQNSGYRSFDDKISGNIWSPDQIQTDASGSWKYNPNSTWRVGANKFSFVDTNSPNYDPWSMNAPTMTDAYRSNNQVQRLVNGQWQDYSVPHEEEMRYLMSGIFDPDLYGDKAVTSSPLFDFFQANPSALGQINERSTYGYDANMYQPDSLVGFLSGFGENTGTTGMLGELYDPNAAAEWGQYMSPGAQSQRAKARQQADVMEGLKFAGLIAGGIGLGNLLTTGNLLGGISNAGFEAFGPELYGGLSEGAISTGLSEIGLLPGAEFAGIGSDTALGAGFGADAMSTGFSGLDFEMANSVGNAAGSGGVSTGTSFADAAGSIPNAVSTGGVSPIPDGIQTLEQMGLDPAKLVEDLGLPNIPGSKGGMTLGDYWNILTDPSKWTASGMLDVGRGLAGLYGLYNSNRQADDLRNTSTDLAGDRMDRSFYRDELKKSYTEPWNFPEADTMRRDIRQMGERMGARGGNNPLHTEYAIQSKLLQELEKRRTNLGNFAGAQFDPMTAATLQLQGLRDSQGRQRSGIDSFLAGISGILQGQVNPREDAWRWLFGV